MIFEPTQIPASFTHTATMRAGKGTRYRSYHPKTIGEDAPAKAEVEETIRLDPVSKNSLEKKSQGQGI